MCTCSSSVGMGQKSLFGQTPTVGGGTTGGLFGQQQQQTPLFGRQMGMTAGLGTGGLFAAGGGECLVVAIVPSAVAMFLLGCRFDWRSGGHPNSRDCAEV